MKLKDLEAKLNRRLHDIRRGYALKNLKRLPGGEYWFDLAMAFNARDVARVNRAFADVLGTGRSTRRETVQAKFYLSTSIRERLRKEAASRGMRQSRLVEEALESVLG